MAEAAAWPRNGGTSTPGREPVNLPHLLGRLVDQTGVFADSTQRICCYAHTPKPGVTEVWFRGRPLGEAGGVKRHYWAFHFRIRRERFRRLADCLWSVTYIPKHRTHVFEAHKRMFNVFHPNLTSVTFTLLAPEAAVVVQPYVPHSLVAIDLDRAAMLRMMGEAAAGLAYLHASGLIHRDIAPENMLVDADGHLKLCDYDSVAAIPEGAPTMEWAGTICRPKLSPPEVLARRDVGYASDVWSFAVTLYAMLQKVAGVVEERWLPRFIDRAHRRGGPWPEVARRLEELPRVVRWPADTPSPLQDLVDCGFSPEMEWRPTAAAAQRALEEIVRGVVFARAADL